MGADIGQKGRTNTLIVLDYKLQQKGLQFSAISTKMNSLSLSFQLHNHQLTAEKEIDKEITQTLQKIICALYKHSNSILIYKDGNNKSLVHSNLCSHLYTFHIVENGQMFEITLSHTSFYVAQYVFSYDIVFVYPHNLFLYLLNFVYEDAKATTHIMSRSYLKSNEGTHSFSTWHKQTKYNCLPHISFCFVLNRRWQLK